MTAAGSKGTFTGRHMLLAISAFFGVVVTVNVGMAVVAATSWTGLVVDNSYVASQEFEAKRLARNEQRAKGWVAEFAYFADEARLTVSDGGGAPVDLGAAMLKLSRPVGGHDDQLVELVQGADGSYAAAVTVAGGVWDALIVAPATSAGPFELHQRFRVIEVAP